MLMAVGTTHDRSMREWYLPKVPGDAVGWLWVAWRKGGGCFNLVKSHGIHSLVYCV